MTSRLVDEARNSILLVAVALDKLAITFRFLDRIQIFALDVLDQSEFGRGRGVNLPDDLGTRVDPAARRAPPPPLPRHDLEAVVSGSKQDRLQNSALGDG